jgi:hypothetical protein
MNRAKETECFGIGRFTKRIFAKRFFAKRFFPKSMGTVSLFMSSALWPCPMFGRYWAKIWLSER